MPASRWYSARRAREASSPTTYADNSWDFYNPTWVEVGLNASHMSGPHHVLFEGNYSQNFDSDYTHGNAIYMTVFRNWLSGQRRSFTDTSAMFAPSGLPTGRGGTASSAMFLAVPGR